MGFMERFKAKSRGNGGVATAELSPFDEMVVPQGAERGNAGASTVTLDWIRELDAAAKTHGCELIDAPVTGSKAAAAGGELSFIVGGSETTLNRARPVLEVMSKSITHLGPVGSGSMVKLINNFVCGVQLTSMAEAIAMLERTGIDREKGLGVMLNGAPGSPMVKLMTARMTAKDYSPNFLMRLLAKDLGYAMKEAAERSVKLTTAQTALNLLQNAISQGYGDFDMSAVVEPLRKQ